MKAVGPSGLVDNGNRAYSDTNPPQDLDMTQTASAAATPAAGLLRLYVNSGRPYFVDATGAIGRLDNTQARDFTRQGNLAVVAGTIRLPIAYSCVIESVAAAVATAPTGSSAILDVNKNGTTIFTTQTARPTFAAGSNLATVGTPAVTTLAAGDYITVDIDQIGSTVAGADLVLSLTLRRI